MAAVEAAVVDDAGVVVVVAATAEVMVVVDIDNEPFTAAVGEAAPSTSASADGNKSVSADCLLSS